MTSQNQTDQLDDLQSQLAFQDDALNKMSDELYLQQKRISELEQQLQQMKDLLLKSDNLQEGKSPGDEVPPHY